MNTRAEPATDWLTALLASLAFGKPAVLVTVARIEGSAPREAGARMAVGKGWATDTIGGGHLELCAIEEGKRMLASDAPRRQCLRYPLGAKLGQCCGGVAWLAFEVVDTGDRGWLERIRSARVTGQALWRHVSLRSLASPVAIAESDALQCTHLTLDDKEPASLVDYLPPPEVDVVLCGAGHVGQAIARLLGDLPCRVFWLDPREERFPASVPSNISIEVGDAADVRRMPAKAYWLVLTHSHALDFELIEAILARGDARFVGLIGSKSKKNSFVGRLQHKGVSPEQIATVHCPIGVSGIASKLPAAIAVSLVAELLQQMGE